ncbi:glycosyltransferase family 2 protein [Roseobacter sp. EG26]|uniref:glycosyltransferase family 2 protein n=1 Tax=Roseobacter sp. EG26 TaxID=3412477 RepID=UPI003CE4DDB9
MSRRTTEENNDRVLERELNAVEIEGAKILEAVKITRGDQRYARILFETGTAPEGISPSSTDKNWILRNYGGAPVLDIEIDPLQETTTLEVRGQNHDITLHQGEGALFADLNVVVAVRNGETVEAAADWLRYHVSQHGMDGAVILDQNPSKDNRGFVRSLNKKAHKIAGLKRLVILHCSVPLGKAGLPAEAHPFNAPRAPGKDRMEIPPEDPWRAPLGEYLIYEIIRARFLSRARAVANIDLFDLLAREGGKSIFDSAVEAPSGCIPLEGVQAYPWRVRKGAQPRFADHICTQFDTTEIRRRWCLAPNKAPGDCIWRLIRVVGVEPDTKARRRFYRCMALRHPSASISKIVPKTSLIESPELIDLVQNYFKANPVRIPEERPTDRKNKAPKTTIVTTMKNEGPFIIEWLAYHRMIGVDDFLVYTNDCTDGTDTLLQLLETKGFVQHRENPFKTTDLKPQHAALRAADDEPIIRNADWVVCMDVDEFINIKCGAGRLPDLFDAIGDANMISMTWRLFGNSDVCEYADTPIIGEFVRCAHELTRKPHQAWGFKTLFRNDGIFKKLGVHRPKGLKPQLWEEISWVNGSGTPMPRDMFRNGWRSSMDTFGYDLVQLNHYAVRSAESFLVKRDRGRVNHVDRDQGLSYWFRMNNNAEEERSIQRMIPALKAEMSKLLKDPEIAAAHAYSVNKHREKIEELKKQPEFLSLFQELTGTKLKHLSRMHAHFGANVFLNGPGVIPDEIAQKNPGDDFWFSVEKGKTTH